MATAALRSPRAESSRLRRLLSARNLIVIVVAVVIAYLAAVPLGFLLWQTFVKGGEFSLHAFRTAYTEVGLGKMVVNSLVFALGSTALAIALGTVLAYLIVRTDVPGKPLMFAASLVPLIIPGVLHTISWAYFILSPQIGIGNTWFIEKIDGGHPFNVFSLGGMIFIEGLHLSPLVFLLMVAAFRSMDPSLEESAIMSGASLLTVFRRITVPLARPALYAAILIMVVRTLESFEVPAVVGMNNHIWVFTSRIWRVLDNVQPDFAVAGAYAMSLLVLTSAGIIWHSQLSKRARAFQTVTGKGFRPRPVALGAWKWPATGMIYLYFLIAVVLPVLVLAYASSQPFYSPPSKYTLSNMSWENYSHVLHDPVVGHAFKNSIILAFGSATTIMLLTAVASWVVVRTKLPGRWLIDNLAFIPLIVPGLVLGVALLAIYLRTPWLPVYGSLWILFIAYLTRFMPYGMRYASTSMFQIGRELEESAAMSGAGWLATFRRVVLPLLVPGFLAGWIYILIVSVRELGSSVLLYTPGHEVLSIVIWEYWRDGNLPYVGALGILMIGTLIVLVGIAYKLGAKIGVRDS
jgi:iron(III) transport system permease protein